MAETLNGRAARTPGKAAHGNRCHGSLVGRVQVVAEGVPPQKLPVAALDVVLHRVAIGVPTRVQQPARGVRHHIPGIVVRQLELTIGVQPGDAIERQSLGYGRDVAQPVAVVAAGQLVKRAEGLHAVEVADGVNNAVAHDIGHIAAQVVAVIYREVGYAVSLNSGSVRQAFRRSEGGGFQTVERVIRVRVAALGPRAFGDVAVVARRVFQCVADGGGVCPRAVCGLL